MQQSSTTQGVFRQDGTPIPAEHIEEVRAEAERVARAVMAGEVVPLVAEPAAPAARRWG